MEKIIPLLLSSSNSCVLDAQLCPTLCNPMDYSPARLLSPWDFSGKNTGVGCHFLFQGIFPTQGSNLSFLHCRQILYHLSHQGSPMKVHTVGFFFFLIQYYCILNRLQYSVNITFICTRKP